MNKQRNLKPLVIAVGAALTAGMAATSTVNAAENLFAMTELSADQVANGHGEGKCGEGKCGEGKCGGEK
jgi:uncharacterized low-complexity protein